MWIEFSFLYVSHNLMRKKLFLAFLVILTLPVISLIIYNRAHSQAYRGLIINELIFNIEDVPRGTSVIKEFTVTHDFDQADKVVEIYVKALDFTSNGEDGTPVFVEPGTFSEDASLASWIEFEREHITLDHYLQEETIRFTITVPQNAEPGGRYAGIILSDEEGKNIDFEAEGSELGLTKELGPLVLLTTDGDVSRTMSLDDLFTQNIKGKKSSFFFNPPVIAIARIKNDGNVHIDPKGVIYFYRGDDFQKYDTKVEINEDGGYILPGTTREFAAGWTEGFIYTEKVEGKEEYKTKINWDKLSKLRIGKYKVKLLYSYETEEGQTITQEGDASYWVFPWQIILLIVLIILLIIARIMYRKSKGKKTKNEEG